MQVYMYVCALHGSVHTVAVDVFSLCPVNVSSSSCSSPPPHFPSIQEIPEGDQVG